ncbi:hypothetical protein OpiT1DRAFT_03973 [Opitutaceae bacterium TAV1]|nr:hypothetical protein OpiT1DRAFT_03973 [Opitutaceae bacterium TAV1]
MKPWITLSVAQLDTVKAAALVDALRTAALRENQPDPLPEIITTVTDRIRAEIAAGGKTRLSANPERIPPSLKSIALRMVLREGQGRLNIKNALALSDDDRKQWDKDDRYLERIAGGNVAVEMPDDPEPEPTVQSASALPMITGRDRKFTRDQQDGI